VQIERIELANLSSDPSNARKHDEKNIASIVSSLKRFGQQKPIVIDLSNVVRAGNGTLEAARSLGWIHIDCVRTDLKGSDAIAYAIADNRTAELAEWDDDVLSATLNGLLAEDPDLLNAAGFDEEELANMLGESFVDVTEDDVPEPPVDPITKPGDLWILGSHRLLCGDSTKEEDVERLMADDKADLWITDPPYNVDYVGKTKDSLKIQNDAMSEKDFREFLYSAFRLAFERLKPGASFYIWHSDKAALAFLLSLELCKQSHRQILVWVKNCLVMNRTDYQPKHEPCFYGWKDGASHSWNSDRKQTTVLEFDKPARSSEHATMKPVALFAYQIGNSTGPQGVVLDSFGGSGTTIAACEALGRNARLIELSPSYCDVIVKRWENLTGRKAVLDDSRHEDDSESTPAEMADKARVQRRIGKTSGKDNSRPEKQSARSDVSV